MPCTAASQPHMALVGSALVLKLQGASPPVSTLAASGVALLTLAHGIADIGTHHS